MKIDRKFRKTLSEIPVDCKQLIEKLKNCTDNDTLYNELCQIKTWNIGKCELYHWADVLDRCDNVLEQAASKLSPDSWQLTCDLPDNNKLKKLLLSILQFTALLIEHSYSRHLYNSIEHLTILLESTDFHVILSVLNLLYVFSKRSIFINRLAADKKQALIQRLLYLAESWGGKENGLDLVKCCCYADLSNFPASATTVNFEYQVESSNTTAQVQSQQPNSQTNEPTAKSIITKVVRLEKVHQLNENPASIMERVIKEYDVPEDKRVLLYTYIRLAHSFPNYEKRKLFVQTRLQSLSILVYSGAITDHASNLLYDGLIEELVDVLTVKELHGFSFPEIKAASLKTLTAIIHLEKVNKLNEIIETTQASSYYGLLPTLVRKCVDHLIDPTKEPFPHQFATSLFSFLYHLATYDTGGDALVKCGIMETLLKVVNHNQNSQEYIMFVTRAVRVIDLITNLDMTSFESHQGLVAFINRLEYEVNECRKEQPYSIKVKKDLLQRQQSRINEDTLVDTIGFNPTSPIQTDQDQSELEAELEHINQSTQPIPNITCYHQRSALLKSILNFFKKAIADSSNNNVPNLGDSIRHMMENSLPNSLKHIISNADYYGPSLFLLATDVVQLFIFQEPSQLSQLQENGLTDVILYALLKKNVPATREVLGSLPTVFSALCLNNAGLNAFIASKPFDKLFQVLLSPDYLPAMRRRRTTDQLGGNNSANQQAGQASSSGTATQLGSAMDELMRHQPSLRIEAMNSIIKLLNRLIEMGKNPSYICQRQNTTGSSTSAATKQPTANPSTTRNRRSRNGDNQQAGQQAANAQSSEDEDEEYENTMMVDAPTATTTSPAITTEAPIVAVIQKPVVESVPLLDYITNIMKFIEAILSNNSTDDHCKEFVKQKGLVPLLQILSLPNLPIDFPTSTACQSVSQVCKSILNLAREPDVIDYTLTSLIDMFTKCEVMVNACDRPLEGSLLIKELAQSDNPLEAINDPTRTPLLHYLCGIHSFVYLLITLGKTSQNEIRNLNINLWGSPDGTKVLKDLCKLYMTLIWESSILLWLCNEEAQQTTQTDVKDSIIQNFDYNKNDLDKLKSFIQQNSVQNEISEKMDEGATTSSTSTQTPTSSLLTFSKLLRPLFTCTSKLGRSLCELFSLLVKLSAGSPWKSQHQRRNQLQPQQTQNQPNKEALNVASTLADLANASLVTKFAHTDNINPKFRLTFYICSVAFTSSILFDELKRPYHLTLKHFEECGGLKSFFDAFNWSLNYFNVQATNDKDKLQEGTLEFIESWLNLVQKLVNTKTMLETRHALPTPSQAKQQQQQLQPQQQQALPTTTFDPIKFLFKVHKETFIALMNLWDKKFVKENNLSETLLNILCQILIGDSQLQKKLTERESVQATAGQQQQQQQQAPISEIPINPFVRRQPIINQEYLLEMVDMGFSNEQAAEALTRFPESLESAVEYCFNNPPTAQTPQVAPIIAQERLNETQVNLTLTDSNKTQPQITEDVFYQLDKNTLDNFANTMLPGLFRILDNVPETVYRVCDLLVVLIRKYGDGWRDNCLNYLLNETIESMKVVMSYYQSTNTTKPDNMDQKLASRYLLFSLLFEEMQLACARIVNTSDLLEKLVSMLNTVGVMEKNFTNDLSKTQTPPWLTSLFILIDLIEKSSLATKRKANINEIYSGHNRIWKWYEERQNRWIPYAYANNKTIDDAYKNGDSHVKIISNRKSYLITFNSMIQINEETSHKRPIMLSFEKQASQQASLNENENLMNDKRSEENVNTDQPVRPSSPLPIELVKGLEHEQIMLIIERSVGLIGLPVSDSDCLHAILRLILRLTRQYDYAVHFASLKGPQNILNLTQKNSFMGHASLITLIFRHICENESNLRLTMEKAIRLALSNTTQSNMGMSNMNVKELHNVMRILGPAICRHPDLFCEVATDVLRIVIRREDEITGPNTLTNGQSCSLKALQAKLMPLTSLPDYAHELVVNLLDYLVKVVPQVNAQNLDPKTKDSDKNKTQSQPLLAKSGILRILSELVRSYAGCAKIVTSHIYKQGQSEIITEDCSTLAFVLDNLLPPNQTFGDKDCSSLSRLLIVALASCNHCLDSQNALVNEVKLSLNRTIILPESNDKHIKLQSIASIINTMIETCPTIQTQQQQQNGQPQRPQPQQNIVNNMMKIMHKKGLINDLARVPHSIDLASIKAIDTINSLLKPLETMTKTLNIATRKRELQQPKSIIPTIEGTTEQATGQVAVSQPQVATGQAQASTTAQVQSDEQMVDLNMTEMEPQQALPQDVDMPSMPPSSRRDLEERVLDVIEALNQEGETDSEEEDDYEGQNRVIRIEADENNDAIHIQIEDEENGDDNDVDLSEEENSSGEDDEMNLGEFGEGDHDHDASDSSTEPSESEHDDEEGDEDEEDDVDEDEEDEEDMLEGSDGRSAVSSYASDEEHEGNNRNENHDTIEGAVADALANVAGAGDLVRRRSRDQHNELDEGEEEDEDNDEEDQDDDEEMDLDEEDDEGEIIEEDDDDENDEGDEEDGEEDDLIDENDEDDHDDTSEYFDAYNQMIDFMNETNEGEDEDFLMHFEGLWPNPAHHHHLVLGSGANTNRAIQIAVGTGLTGDASLPPQPLSVSVTHPLLAHHGDNVLTNPNLPASAQLQLQNATRMRTTQQMRSRISRFIIPGLNLQLTANIPTPQVQPTNGQAQAPGQQQPTQRHSNLPYNTLSEILQGFEAPMPQNTYEMLVNGLYNTPLTAGQEFMTYNEGNEGNGPTNLYIIRTPLARWNEESTVLDGHSMHHAILLIKPKILEVLEKYRNEELAERREKRAKEIAKKNEEEEKERQARAAAAATQSTQVQVQAENQEAATPAIEAQQGEPQVEIIQAPSENIEVLVDEPNQATNMSVESALAELVPAQQPSAQEVPQSENQEQQASVIQSQTEVSQPESNVSIEVATAFLVANLSGTCNIFTLNSEDEKAVAIEALRVSNHQQASNELGSIQISNYPQNFVFMNERVISLPSGIDPSFLSALPDDLRREVIAEQLRMEGIDINARPQATQAQPQATSDQQTAPSQTPAAATSGTASAIEINPEFLAALPPNIQEELLAQQRLEQQAQNPAATDDNTAFIRALSGSLRTQVLLDMDQSQIAALPEDLAQEAQALQRQHREREMDLFAAAAAHRSNALFGNRYTISSTNRFYNAASTLLADGYLYGGPRGAGEPGRLRRGFRRMGDGEMNPMLMDKLTRGGRQLLDHESLACLLVLLFLEDQRLNTIKLHRVVRNLCIHGPSRTWIIKALLSILEKVCGKPESDKQTQSQESKKYVGTGAISKSGKQKDESTKQDLVSCQPSWLTMSIDGAFGSKTNVFTINRLNNTKKSQTKLPSDNSTSITINPQACPAIIKQVLDILSTLARAANFNFFPKYPFKQQQQGQTPSKQTQPGNKQEPQFWDLVVKLDQSKSKTLKTKTSNAGLNTSSGNLTSTGSTNATSQQNEENENDFTIDNSPLARLMSMLEYSILKSSPALMDKIFNCLAHASAGIQISDGTNESTEPVLIKQIELVVNVLKNKLCTQDGLNQAYILLNNLSKINSATRNMIIKHLLEGTRELGFAVCQEIDTLLEEAQILNVQKGHQTTEGTEGMEQEAPTTIPGTSYELISSNQQNLIDRYSNLVISSPKQQKVHELQLPSMSKLVEKNSNQKFFVRLIKLIIQLRETIEKEAKKKRQQQQQQQQQQPTEGEQQAQQSSAQQEPILNRLSAELELDVLWNKLSQCLNTLKSLSDPYAVLILQQTVEAFFYVHATRKDKDETKKRERETKEAQLAHLDSEAPMSPGAGPSINEVANNKKAEIETILNTIGNEAPDTKKFLEFALTHRTVLNHILRQTSNNLSDEPYSVLVDFTRLHTHILDFDVKRRYFRQELDKLKDSIRAEDLAVHVKRSQVFDDSYRELNRRSPDDWKHRFYIVFEGEEGQDAGGLLREWYMIISKEIFNPDYALFMINPGDRVTYMPNPSSHFNPNHLSYFKFIGHIIAKAIFDNKYLDCYFTRAFYKQILGVPVKYTDMESVDNEFYKNLVSILESDIETLGVDLTFSIDINEFGVTKAVDLKSDGCNIRVTNENKAEYVRLVCQEKMIGSIRQQVSAFLQGFYEIIPKNLISIFNEQELELLISGLPEIDLEDLRRNTEYHKYTSNSLQIQWFWRALKSFDKDDQAKFLQFVTGTSKVPLQGFAKLEGMNGPQKFQIHRDDRDTSRLPCAHTCFNQLDLPAYENFEKLRTMLLMAIRECSTGFGLA